MKSIEKKEKRQKKHKRENRARFETLDFSRDQKNNERGLQTKAPEELNIYSLTSFALFDVKTEKIMNP